MLTKFQTMQLHQLIGLLVRKLYPVMSNELAKTNNGYIIPNVSNDVTEGIAEELNGLNISLDI